MYFLRNPMAKYCTECLIQEISEAKMRKVIQEFVSLAHISNLVKNQRSILKVAGFSSPGSDSHNGQEVVF